jgi:hypothetical protein
MNPDLAQHAPRRIDGKRVISREYSAWQMLKTYCLNRRCPEYHRYGGAGVGLDPKWLSFEGFLEDMGPKPAPDAALHRIDPAHGFSKDNCYWGPPKRRARVFRAKQGYDIPQEFRQWVSLSR